MLDFEVPYKFTYFVVLPSLSLSFFLVYLVTFFNFLSAIQCFK